MDCPRTGKPMEEVDLNGIKVDVSTGCGGVWFDNFEFEKFDEPHESVGEQLVDLMEKYHGKDIAEDVKINCPRCKDITMMRHYFSVKRNVEIDECAKCGGIWLDPGELAVVRSLFANEAERDKAAEEMISDLFKSPEIKALKEKSGNDLKKARRFANMFKYICPTYYVPGDQDWGAF